MISQIAVALCAVISVANGHSQTTQRPSNDANIACDVLNTQCHDCGRSESGVTEHTWYHEEVFIRVVNGSVTLELLANDSKPKTVNAEERRIFQVNQGFARIPSVDWLSLRANYIERITSSVFNGLPQLAYLNLAGNRIKYLDKNSFKGLANLKTLILNHNFLKGGISFLTTTNILPSLTGLFMQHNELQYIDVNYDQPGRFCNSNLRHLYLSNNSLTTLRLNTKNNASCLGNLTHLYLEDNNLDYFNIGKLPLQALSLDRNFVHKMPTINPELKFLSMEKNRISNVGNLKNSRDIVRIILSYNRITDLRSSAKFQNLSSLEHVALDHNNIRQISNGSFYNLPSLRSVYLADNRIDDISPNAFAKLPALKELSLRNNKLKSFPGKDSFGKSNLTYLDLSCNKIENISSIQANWIPKLKAIKLTGNPVKRIEPLSVSSDTTILF